MGKTRPGWRHLPLDRKLVDAVKSPLDAVLSETLARLKPRAKSLIVTVYGDAILPHGGTVWLGSLIRLLEPFGLNERIIRTSVFRLAKDNWLTASQIGRRSYYGLTETGRNRIEAAHRRIYAHGGTQGGRPWDGRWTLVLTGALAVDPEPREALRRDLAWQGFGQMPGGAVMLHPDPDPASVRQALLDAGAGERAVVLRGGAESWVAPEAVRELTRGCWDLASLAADYTRFLDLFRPVWRALDGAASLDPETCFLVRTLTIHGYRRALLPDPLLPEEALPADWPGAAARLLCRNLYRLVQARAQRHLMETLETAEGPLPDAAAGYYARFGGLPMPSGGGEAEH